MAASLTIETPPCDQSVGSDGRDADRQFLGVGRFLLSRDRHGRHLNRARRAPEPGPRRWTGHTSAPTTQAICFNSSLSCTCSSFSVTDQVLWDVRSQKFERQKYDTRMTIWARMSYAARLF